MKKNIEFKLKKILRNLFSIIKNNKIYIIFCVFIIALIYLLYKYYYRYFYIMKDPKKIRAFVMGYGKYGTLIFLFIQIVQVVIFFVPGEIVQVAGGYIYGTFKGSIISILGITIGSLIAFIFSNIFGKPFIEKIICKKDLKVLRKILNFGNINFIVFLLYLIPGIPKDALAYVCGVSNIKMKDFFLYSTIARLPCVFISSYFGSEIYFNNIGTLITIGVVMTLIFLIGILKGEKIIKYIVKKR